MIEEPQKQEVISLCKQLIQQPSTSGQEGGVAQVIASYMKAHGFTNVHADAYGNMMGSLVGKRPGPTVLFDGHMDTVPVPDQSVWTHAPFAAEELDGRIYGRGTSDMKGALASMLVAAAAFAKATAMDFAGTLTVGGVVHEECFEGVAARSISKEVQPDYVVIGEASHLNLKIGQRGRAEIVLESFGKSCHSANPEKGINAVYKIMKAIEAIQQLEPPHHPIMGDGILELTDIQSHPYPGASVVPDACRATYDRRLLVGETKETVLAPLKDLLDRLMKEDPQARYRVSYATGRESCYTGAEISGERFFPGWLEEEQTPWIQRVKAAIEARGGKPSITQYNFCTNGSHYAGEAGIPTIGFGPSIEALAHTVDEYVELTELTGAVDGYQGIMTALLS